MAGRWWAAVVAAGVLVAPACSGSDDTSATDAAETVATVAPAGDVGSADGADALSGESFAQSGGAGVTERDIVPALAEVETRDLIRTAEVTVVAKDVTKATEGASSAATAAGGYVFGRQDEARGDETSVLTIKVPPDRFDALLDELGGLGKVEQRNVATDDVTAQGVDLDARILSATRSVERVRAFLEEAKNVGELSGVEAELSRRETELEQLQGQRRVLDAQVALATVTLTINATPAPEPPPPPAGDSLRSVPGFGDALADGVGALVKVGRVVGAGLGYALPFAALIGVVLLVRRVVRRRSRSGWDSAAPSIP